MGYKNTNHAVEQRRIKLRECLQRLVELAQDREWDVCCVDDALQQVTQCLERRLACETEFHDQVTSESPWLTREARILHDECKQLHNSMEHLKTRWRPVGSMAGETWRRELDDFVDQLTRHEQREAQLREAAYPQSNAPQLHCGAADYESEY